MDVVKDAGVQADGFLTSIIIPLSFLMKLNKENYDFVLREFKLFDRYIPQDTESMEDMLEILNHNNIFYD